MGPQTRHVARMLLIGIYTGTRPGAILALRWLPSIDAGWFDLDAGVLVPDGQRGSSIEETPAARKDPWPTDAALATLACCGHGLRHHQCRALQRRARSQASSIMGERRQARRKHQQRWPAYSPAHGSNMDDAQRCRCVRSIRLSGHDAGSPVGRLRAPSSQVSGKCGCCHRQA